MELDSVSKQLWFADAAADAVSLQAVKEWWDTLAEKGPKYGYFVNLLHNFCETRLCTEGSMRLGDDNGGKFFMSSPLPPQVCL